MGETIVEISVISILCTEQQKNCCTLIVNNLKETLSVGKHAIMHLLIIKWKTKLRKNKTLFINTVNQ